MLEDVTETLLRQVHPTQILQDGSGRPDSSAFMPRGNEEGLLSTRREAITPQRAYEDWVNNGDHLSDGSWTLNVGDALKEQLPSFDDSARDGNPEGHASVDYNEHSLGVRKKKAQRLREKSQRLYPASTPKTPPTGPVPDLAAE
jgi:hypothetical protein